MRQPNISAKLKRGHPQSGRQMQVGVAYRLDEGARSWKLATFEAKRCQLSSVASL